MRFHVLMIRFSSLGDVVIQTSVVQWLKATYGEQLRVSFVTSKEFRHLVEGHPLIHRVLCFDRKAGKLPGLAREIRQLHSEDPIDLVIDLHATTRSTLLRCKLWNLPRLVVDKRRLERWLLVRLPVSWMKRFVRWSWLGMEEQVKRVPLDWQGLMLAPPLTDDSQPRTFTPSVPRPQHSRPYVVLSPVASFAPKRWPIESFVELARQFLQDPRYRSYDLVVVGGPADTYCEAFQQLNDPRLLNLQGKTNLAESMGWVQSAQLVVGNDSGMNHLAEAAGVPCVTLFGPTHEAFGFAPYGPRSKTISHELWCRPCSPTGKRECFRSEQFCFTLTTPARVLQDIQQCLGVA